MALNPEMQQWLSANGETYEFYLLHALYNDPVRRSSLLGFPLEPKDFAKDEHLVLMAAFKHAHRVMNVIGVPLPNPLTLDFMKSYINSATRSEEMDLETQQGAEDLMAELSNPDHASQWYCIEPYFEPWITTIRGKRYARQVQMASVADMPAVVAMVQRDIAAAASAMSTGVDEMDDVMDGTSTETPLRRSTGVLGLDACLNGGWGAGECYLLFGGTGGGKSIAAAQCAWHEANNGGYPLIVSTELRAREYVVRIVSNAVGIPINLIQDCENFQQIRQAMAMNAGMAFKIANLEKVLQKLRERLRVAKISVDDGMDARSTLEREVEKYRSRYGVKPTWVCLDWLGSMADVGGGAKGTSERAMVWETSASSCVRFADTSNIPTLVLAQAVNNAQRKHTLAIDDIGISKGIGKNMVAVIGITNTLNEQEVKAAILGKTDLPSSMTLPDQLFCVCKARKGEGANIPVIRDFKFQRFECKPKK